MNLSQFNEQQDVYSIIDAVDASIYWKDLRGRYLGCNQYMLNMAGLAKRSDIIGKKDIDLPWRDFAKELKRIDKLVLSTGSFEGEEKPTIHNNAQRIFHTKKTILFDVNNKPIGIIGISIDITKEKQAKIAKEDFISNMEHDLRTPFTGIGGIINMLDALYSEKYPELKEWLTLVKKSCAQWEAVHHRIFEALIIEQSVLVNIQSFSLVDELKQIQEMMDPILHLKQLKLHIETIPHELNRLKSDPFKFRLILSSLISNAINFTEHGFVKIVVYRQENHCVIEIIDTGIGIPSNMFEYIFEKFTKLSRSNTHGSNFKGLGLGLYTAQFYANQLNVNIEVESEVGKGSTFRLRIPLV
jgi:two-component system aerobic respiration control sensor histidine kinase ArcB